MRQRVRIKVELTMSYDDVEWTDAASIRHWVRNRCWETLMTEGEPSDKLEDLHDWEVSVIPVKEG